MKKEDIIKEYYEYCEQFDLSDEELVILSEYIDNLTKTICDLQENINKNNIVNFMKYFNNIKEKTNDNKKNS